MLADYRFGSGGEPLQTDHSDLSKWTLTDAAAVWHGYRYGVPKVSPEGQGLGFETLSDFQDRSYSWSEGIRRSIFIGDYAEESVSGAIPFLQCYLVGCN
jgi:hypothetical protein